MIPAKGTANSLALATMVRAGATKHANVKGAQVRLRGVSGMTPRIYIPFFVLLFIFFIGYSMWVFLPAGSAARMVVYCIPLLSLGLWAIFWKSLAIQKDARFVQFCIFYLLAVSLSLINERLVVGHSAIPNILILLGSIIVFVPLFRVPAASAQLCLAYFFIIYASRLVSGEITFGIADDLTDSASGVGEAQESLVFGALAVFFFTRRHALYFLTSCALVFLSFKRVALGSVLISCGIFVVVAAMERWTKIQTRPRVLLCAGALIAASAGALAYMLNDILEFLVLHFDIAKSPNQLAPGRYALNGLSFAILDSSRDVEWLFGHGPGFSNVAAQAYRGVTHLHNDWLKLLIDYGLVGTVLIIGGMVLVYARCAAGIALLAYFCFIMVTDNALIYLYVHFVCFMLLRIQLETVETPVEERRSRAIISSRYSRMASGHSL